MINRAMQFAEEAHKGQTRTFQGIAYVWHPHSVSKLVELYADESRDIQVLRAAAMLHDVPEDCDVKLSTIKEKFGRDVHRLVKEVTSDEEEVEKIGKRDHLKEKVLLISDSGLFLKLCDRLDNISDIRLTHGDFKDRYKSETQEIFLNYLTNNRELDLDHLCVLREIRKFI